MKACHRVSIACFRVEIVESDHRFLRYMSLKAVMAAIFKDGRLYGFATLGKKTPSQLLYPLGSVT